MADGYGSLALAASQYGGYGALDGYEKTIDCNSALGLLGLLGLIELLRDVVENVVEEEEEERRKRSTNSGGPSNFLVGFFRDGGAGRLLHTLPLTLLPLLHNFVDVNDGLESPACLERSICEANHALVSESSSSDGDDALGSAVGSLVSSLMSQVVAKSFTSDRKTYLKAMKAAEVGRRRAAACREVFHECSELKPQHSPSPGANITDILHTRLAHAT
ncbi:uncharacterized protein [Panulirus ornatus]|uniref:uncharacterized protein isoform X1 n=1 Tax=Panulirus ornatus TaxID=150431 RepID=UPI003A88E83F